MLSTIATDLKDISISPDGKEANFVLVTKHSGEIAVSLPAFCLQKLRAAAVVPPTPPATIKANLVGGQKTDDTKAADRVTVTVPNKWLVAADAQRGLVVAVLNHSMTGQFAFALNSSAAVEFATAMTKQATMVSPGKTPGP
jgi:hypothetical protein